MTTIIIYKDSNGDSVGFEVSGHADFAPSGQDIVCAAISILTCTAYNAVETFTEDMFGYEEDETTGYMYFMLNENPSEQSKLLLNAMTLGLSQLEEQYGKSQKFLKKKYLQIQFKEV